MSSLAMPLRRPSRLGNFFIVLLLVFSTFLVSPSNGFTWGGDQKAKPAGISAGILTIGAHRPVSSSRLSFKLADSDLTTNNSTGAWLPTQPDSSLATDHQQEENKAEIESLFKEPQALALIGLLFGVGIICALDRVAMSVALLPMAKEFGYSETDKGTISSAFTLGYMLAMTPAGYLASFYSPTKLLAGGVALWSMAQLLSPVAAYESLNTLLAARFCMGMAEAVTVPTMQALVGRWIPQSSKAKTLSFLISGLQIGTVLAYQTSPAVIENYEWPGIFYVYGATGLIWLFAWLPEGRDDPPYMLPSSDKESGAQQQAAVKKASPAAVGRGEEEAAGADGAAGAAAAAAAGGSIPWGAFARSREVQALAAAHAAQNWGLYLLLAWLPTYFSRAYGFGVAASATSSVGPFLAGIVAGNTGGILSDWIIEQKLLSTTNTRKLFQTVACLGPAFCMHLLAQVPDKPEQAIALFTLAGGLGAFSSSGHASGTQDLARKYTGLIYGATSALSVLAGTASTYTTGYLLDITGQFSIIFELSAAVYTFGALFFLLNFQSRRIFD